MTILIPDWLLFLVVLVTVWKIGRLAWRLVEWAAAEAKWRKERIDYYNIAKHRVAYEREEALRAAGPAASRTAPEP